MPVRILIIYLFLLVVIDAVAQPGRITGKVIDARTLEPLPFVNVFINHTTIGTSGDEKGNFQLDKVPEGLQEIVFSFVGYQSYQVKITVAPNDKLIITAKLIPNEQELQTVNVQGTRDKKWESQMKTFVKVFLGQSKIARECKIRNPWVIEFQEGETTKGNVLTATADQPIIIENDALGYTLTYLMKRFLSTQDSYIIQGDVRFDEMSTFDKNLADDWAKNRREAYLGSPTHLFQSILNHHSVPEGFMIYNGKQGFEKMNTRSTTFSKDLNVMVELLDTAKIKITSNQEKNQFRLQIKKNFEVFYLKKVVRVKTYLDTDSPISWIELTDGTIDVTKNGAVLDPEHMVISGAMSNLRVGDQLPYNYEPDAKPPLMTVIDSLSSQQMAKLKEKPYLVTDKPYYYPGESIWFSAFMKYYDQSKMDTLSRVLYVDLINSKKEIIQSKKYFIDITSAAGDFQLPDTQPGDYYLRAYTSWMRNYSEEGFFMKTIPVLPVALQPVSSSNNQTVDQSNVSVSIKPVAEEYHTRDRIQVNVEIKEEAKRTSISNFSVRVTDTALVANISAMSITDSPQFEKMIATSLKPSFMLDYGIMLRGNFQNKKNIENVTFSLIRGDMQEVLPVTTDDKGGFIAGGFQFVDSSSFAFQAKDKNGKPYGRFTLTSEDIPPVRIVPASFTFKTKPRNPVADASEPFLPGKVLETVTVASTRLDSGSAMFGKPDQIVSGERLSRDDFGTLTNALIKSMYGLQYFTYKDQDEVIKHSLTFKLSAKQFFFPREPILIVDGKFKMYYNGLIAALNEIDIKTVDHVDMIKSPSTFSMYRALSGGGVIAVYLKGGKFSKLAAVKGVLDPKLFQIKKVMGYSIAHQFISPNYDNKEEIHDQPDLRSTIYWNPSIITNDEGEGSFSFYAADNKTHYKIVVEGLTSLGVPFRSERIVQIK